MTRVGEVRHGHARTGKVTGTWKSWHGMIVRCTSTAAPDYPRYGGRGIRVCMRWRLFECFLADMGERPPGRTLDRRDNDGDYTPDNCRWATPTEQTRNRRRTYRTGRVREHQAEQIRWLRAGGMLLREIAVIFDITEATVSRIANGKIWKPIGQPCPVHGARP